MSDAQFLFCPADLRSQAIIFQLSQNIKKIVVSVTLDFLKTNLAWNVTACGQPV